jgi:hypothetical protein
VSAIVFFRSGGITLGDFLKLDHPSFPSTFSNVTRGAPGVPARRSTA